MDYLKKFICEDRDKALGKIEFLLDSGKESLHLVLDFDRTITKNRNKLGKNVSTWEILSSYLPEKAQEEYQKLYNRYRPLEVENKMKIRDAVIWGEKVLNLYKENRLKYSDIMNDLERKMPIRPCTKELFDLCEKKDIPTIIISAGIKNVIETWCHKFGIKPTVILSTRLFFDSKGYVKGWEKESFIHALNKKEKECQEISKIRSLRPNAILIGDSIDDAFMASGVKNVLRIILDDSQAEGMQKDEKSYKEIFKKFDLILKNKNLGPVTNIVKLF